MSNGQPTNNQCLVGFEFRTVDRAILHLRREVKPPLLPETGIVIFVWYLPHPAQFDRDPTQATSLVLEFGFVGLKSAPLRSYK